MVEELFSEENKIGAVVLIGVVLLLFMGMALLLFFYFSRKKIVQKELEKKNLEIDHQKKLLHATIVTQEKERKRIAQDLHDDISSKLNIVSLNSYLLQNKEITEEEVIETTNNIIEMTGKALESSRRIAHDLSPPILQKFGLKAAIEELCEEFNSSKKVQAGLRVNSTFDKFKEHDNLHVYRILQELMNNSLRHGKATNIDIDFYEKEQLICCEYKDNGRGFDMKSMENQKGLGMKNIESRVDLLKGSLTFESAIDQGVQVYIEF